MTEKRFNYSDSIRLLTTLPGLLPEKAMTGFEFDNCPRGRVVYLIEAGEKKIKVGVSAFPRSRVDSVLRNSGVMPGRIGLSPVIMNAPAVEADFKSHFSTHGIAGEWFSISYEDAAEYLSDAEFVLDNEDDAATAKAVRENGMAGVGRIATACAMMASGVQTTAEKISAVSALTARGEISKARRLWKSLGLPLVPAMEDCAESPRVPSPRELDFLNLALEVKGADFANALWDQMGFNAPLSRAA